MKEQDPKQRFLLMMAICLTFVVVMQFLFPPPAPPPAPAATQQTAQAPLRSVDAAPREIPEEARNFQPSGDYQVMVRVGEEGPGAHGYEAIFSTIGGGMSGYHLLGYYRQPGDPSRENRMLLLERPAGGRDSLRVDSFISGPSRQDLIRTDLRAARYELVEIPADAVVTPAPDDRVKRGENLVFRTVVGDWELVRTYRFPGGDSRVADFTIEFDVAWRNIADTGRILNFNLVGPAGMMPDDPSNQFGNIEFLTARQADASSPAVEIERKSIRELVSVRNMADRDNRAGLAWIGAKNRFFTSLMSVPQNALADSNGATRLLFSGDPAFMPDIKDIQDNLKGQPTVSSTFGEVPVFEEVTLTVEPSPVAAGATYQATYRFFGGPAVENFLIASDPRFEGVVHYSWSYLNILSRLMVRLLTFLDGFLGNYGLAIIAMTLIIKILLHPLNRKSFISMNKMSKLAPMMKEIQKKYANDRPKMQVEMNKFYKSHGVSMAGGCLPMFVQLPIFLALYGAFSQGFSMRHAPFLAPWIKDLSKPDSIYDLGFSIPLLNSSYISLLPILYFVLQYIQMSLQPKPSDPQQAQQQRIMKFMPLMFVFIFYAMPAGLVLYFTVSALSGVAESAWMRKVVLPKLGLGDSPEAAATAAAGVQAGTGAAAIPSEARKKKKKK